MLKSVIEKSIKKLQRLMIKRKSHNSNYAPSANHTSTTKPSRKRVHPRVYSVLRTYNHTSFYGRFTVLHPSYVPYLTLCQMTLVCVGQKPQSIYHPHTLTAEPALGLNMVFTKENEHFKKGNHFYLSLNIF